jgi:outer membrane cobalamin receptor
LRRTFVFVFIILIAAHARATIFGSVRGSVRDPQQRPVAVAKVALQSDSGQWRQTTTTDTNGSFVFSAVPLGSYSLRVEARGMNAMTRTITVTSGAVVTVPIELPVAVVSEQIEVTTGAPAIVARSSTTQTTISRMSIAETPGADRTNSLSMITGFVPGASMVHDQLHIRGGHQVDWLIDGVPVPNTNIASNVGPQFDPKDVEFLEVQRGGFSAEYGDRMYGVFNVVPRNGFESTDEGRVVLSFGSRRSTNDQISLGSHTDRFAYYGSINANRSDYGLETPVANTIHDRASGGGGFASLIFQPRASDQLRLNASSRADSYQIPNDQDAEATGVRDRERERDTFVNLSWLHIADPSALLTVAPFFHQNSSNFDGGPNDPIITVDHRTSRYAGGQLTLATTARGNDARIGGFGFHQNDEVHFGLLGGGVALNQRESPQGNVGALFAEDRYDVTSWLTARAGLRYTRFSSNLHESATSPRAGVAIRLPANVVLRASYGHYYQAPPLSTVSGPLLQFALQQGFDFLPLRGERDRQSEVGVAVPIGRWSVDAAAFRTDARNFFDHDALGNSNIFFPLTIDRVHIRGFEAAVQSTSIAGRADVHLAYSHQTVQGEGGVVGGMTDFSPPREGRFFLDHDQRDTLNAGATIRLPRMNWIGGNLAYGSGFLSGNGPGHLPSHTTFDLAAGTAIGQWSVKLTALNVTNRRYLLDESNTFGGTHYADPRELSAQVGYRFHY